MDHACDALGIFVATQANTIEPTIHSTYSKYGMTHLLDASKQDHARPPGEWPHSTPQDPHATPCQQPYHPEPKAAPELHMYFYDDSSETPLQANPMEAP